MYFTDSTFKIVPSIFDLVLTYRLVYSLTVILLHFLCFLRPGAQSPCQNAREGVGNIKRKIDRYYFFTQWLAFTDDIIKVEYFASGHYLNGSSLNDRQVVFKRTLISNKHHCPITGVITGASIIDFFSY